MSKLSKQLEKSIILLAAERLEELLDETQPDYYDYGSRQLVKALKEMAK